MNSVSFRPARPVAGNVAIVGAHLASRTIGAEAALAGVAFDSSGHLVLGGLVDSDSSIDFGWGAMTVDAGTFFLAKTE